MTKESLTKEFSDNSEYINTDHKENKLSTLLFSKNDLIRQEMKHAPTIISSKWSEWSSYSKCEKNCKPLSKPRISSKQHLSYSKFNLLFIIRHKRCAHCPLNELPV